MHLASNKQAQYTVGKEDLFFEIRHNIDRTSGAPNEKEVYEAHLHAHSGEHPTRDGEKIKWRLQSGKAFDTEREAIEHGEAMLREKLESFGLTYDPGRLTWRRIPLL